MEKKVFLFGIAVCLLLSGCGKRMIFLGNEEKITRDSVVKAENMLSDLFYVKDGTSFYPMHPFGEESAQALPHPETDNLLLLSEQVKNIPTLYKNESICVKSGRADIYAGVQVERYKPIGWTFGIRKLTYDPAGDYYAARKESIKTGSSIQQVTDQRIDGNHFFLKSVNGDAITLTRAGTVAGLSKDKTAECEVFVGSEYAKMDFICDSLLLESSESFFLMPKKLTTLGYMEYSFPEEARSGYYLIGNAGYVRYLETEKSDGNKTPDLTSPNTFEGCVHAIDDVLEKKTYTKAFRIGELVEKSVVSISYKDDFVQVESAYLKDPDGTRIELDEDFRVILDDPKPGSYTVCLYGYNGMDCEIRHEDYVGERVLATPSPTPSPTPSQTPSPTPLPTKPQEVSITPVTVTPLPTKDATGGGSILQIPVDGGDTYEIYEENAHVPLTSGEIGEVVPG